MDVTISVPVGRLFGSTIGSLDQPLVAGHQSHYPGYHQPLVQILLEAIRLILLIIKFSNALINIFPFATIS